MQADLSETEEHAARMAGIAGLRRLHRLLAQFRRQWALEDAVWYWTWRAPFIIVALAATALSLYCAVQWTFAAPRVWVVRYTPVPEPRMNNAPPATLPAQSARDIAILDYREQAITKIMDKRSAGFWAPLDLGHLNGAAGVAMRLKPDGTLDRLFVFHSSGRPAVDQAVCALVRRAAPFAPFPPEMRGMEQMRIARWVVLNYGDAPADTLIPTAPGAGTQEC